MCCVLKVALIITVTNSNLHSNEILVTCRHSLLSRKVDSSVDGVPEGIPKPIVVVNM